MPRVCYLEILEGGSGGPPHVDAVRDNSHRGQLPLASSPASEKPLQPHAHPTAASRMFPISPANWLPTLSLHLPVRNGS